MPAALQSLRHRNYQLLWIGSLISNSGDWMDQIALNWLVYQLTGSAVSARRCSTCCRLAPILVFTLIGGVIADRVERRRLLFTTQAVAMVLAFVLATLASTGLVQIWMVLLVAVGRGIVPVLQPAGAPVADLGAGAARRPEERDRAQFGHAQPDPGARTDASAAS